jgi:hypothetical protein
MTKSTPVANETMVPATLVVSGSMSLSMGVDRWAQVSFQGYLELKMAVWAYSFSTSSGSSVFELTTSSWNQLRVICRSP